MVRNSTLSILLAAASLICHGEGFQYVTPEWPHESIGAYDALLFCGHNAVGNSKWIRMGHFPVSTQPPFVSAGLMQSSFSVAPRSPSSFDVSRALKGVMFHPEDTLVFWEWYYERLGVVEGYDAGEDVFSAGNWWTNNYHQVPSFSVAALDDLLFSMTNLVERFCIGGDQLDTSVFGHEPSYEEALRESGFNPAPPSPPALESPFRRGAVMKKQHFETLVAASGCVPSDEYWIILSRLSPFSGAYRYVSSESVNTNQPKVFLQADTSGVGTIGGESGGSHYSVEISSPAIKETSESYVEDDVWSFTLLGSHMMQTATKYVKVDGTWIAPLIRYNEDGTTTEKQGGYFTSLAQWKWSSGSSTCQVPDGDITNYVNAAVCGGHLSDVEGLLLARVVGDAEYHLGSWNIYMKGEAGDVRNVSTNWVTVPFSVSISEDKLIVSSDPKGLLEKAIDTCFERNVEEISEGMTKIGEEYPDYNASGYVSDSFSRYASANGTWSAEFVGLWIVAKTKFNVDSEFMEGLMQ